MNTSAKNAGGLSAGTVVCRGARAGALTRAAGTAGTLRRPGGAAALAAGAATLAGSHALAQVAGEQVVHGTASFNRQGAMTTITASNNAIINYNSFNIRANETVRFVQPDSLSRVLNRINSSRPTQIDGSIVSNGKVYIVNPAGIYFAKGAMINVGGLYAAAGTITNQDFVRGVDRFLSAPGGKVVNEGTIQAPIIGLVGEHVANFGALEAPEGAVMMMSGDTVLMGEYNGHVYAKIEAKAAAGPEETARSTGASAEAPRKGRFGAGDMYSLAVWNRGTVKAEQVQIEAERGAVGVAGTVDVSNSTPGERGGSVEVLGQAVSVLGATIDASGDAGGGRILVGGGYQGKGSERNAERTIVTTGAELRADAAGDGDGGTVIVWSDHSTRFDGAISARGGAEGGDGGFAEISSKRSLQSNVDVDLRAPRGANGTLLFDPAFVTIDGGAGDGSDTEPGDSASVLLQPPNSNGVINFSDVGQDKNAAGGPDGSTALDPFRIFESEIENTSASVIIRATQQITTAGTFGGAEVTLQTNASLTLETDASSGSGVIDLTSSLDGANLRFRTQGTGTITISGTGVANTTDITVGRLQTANRDITVGTTNGSVTLAGPIDAGTGTVRLSASGTVAQSGTATITAASIGAAAGADVTLDQAANAADVFAGRTTGGGTVAYRDTDSIGVGTVTGLAGSDAAGISAPGGTVKLRSDTAFVNQTAPIVASTLGVRAETTVGLSNAANDVDTFAAETAGASGSLTFVDLDGFVIGQVTGVGGTTVTGVNSGARDTSLTAGGAVSQTYPIVADKLTLLGAGVYDLTGSASNNATSLQAGLAPGSTVGGVAYLDSNALTLLEGTLVTNNLDVRAATGTLTPLVTTPGATINVGGNLTLTADDISLAAALLNFTSGLSSVLTLQPFTDSTAVHVADGTMTGLHFSQADLNKVSTFPSLVVGSATGTALLSFGGTAAFAQHVALRSGGAGGAVTLLDGSALATGANRNIAVQAGTGDTGLFTMQTGTPATINAGGGGVTITADAVALGAANSIQGTGAILLQPASPGRVIQVGGVDDPTRFSIDPTEFLALQNGFSKIVLGRDDSNAASSIASITANDPLVFQTPAGGTMDVSSLTASSGVALVTGGTLNVSQAFSATNAEITLVSGSNLTIANPIDAGTGTVRLISGGTITQSVGGAITAGALGVRAAGTVDLAEVGNDVGVFAAADSLAGAQITLFNSTALSIGNVAAETLNNGTTYFTATNGVSTNVGPFTLGAGGPIGLASDILVGVASVDGIVRIASTGAVTQTAGRISANRLGVSALGDITITSATNQVAFAALDASLAGSIADVQFRVANGTTIDQVSADGSIFGATAGVRSGLDGDVLVHSGTGGMAITEPIDAGTGTVRLANSATIAQGGSGVITAGALGVRASGTVTLPLANTTPGSLTSMNFAADTGAGNILLNLPDRNLSVGTVGVGGGGIFAATAGVTTTGIARFVLPAGGMTQSAPIVAGSLGVRAADAITLSNASNNVGTFAADIINANQSLAYRDLDGFTVGSVASSGVFALTEGVITAGDASLRAGAGTLQIDRTIDVGGSRDVRLVSGQGIAQTTAAGQGIIAQTLGVNAAGDAKLLNADNDVATFAGSTSAGELKYLDRSGLIVGSLGAGSNGFVLTNGLTTAGGDALLDAAGSLSITQNVSVGAGTLRLVSGAGISQNPGTSVTAAALGFVAGGAVDLSQAINAISAVAGLNSGAGAAATIGSTGPMTVATVDFDADDANFPSVAGVTTSNGLVSLTAAGGTLGVNQPLDAGTGGVLLNAGGTVTVASPIHATGGEVRITTTAGGVNQSDGDILALLLGVRAAGDISLNRVDGSNVPVNNVTTFAATTGSSGGRIAYRDFDALSLGAASATTGFAAVNGLSTTGNAYIQSGGALTQTQGVVANLFGVRAAGPITLNVVDGSFIPLNNVATFAATSTLGGGAIVYRDSNALTVGAVPASAGFGAVTGVSTTGNGDALIHGGGLLTLANSLNVGTGTLRLVGGQGVTQTGGAITAGSLGVRAAGNITLANSANDVDIFAAAATSGDVVFADTDGLAIGTVTASGTFTPTVSGVSASGTVSLQSGAAGAGDLSFNPGVTVSGTAITFRAGDGFGGAGTGAIVDALTNSPTFTGAGGVGATSSFTFRQDADVVDTNLPAVSQFQGSVTPQAYAIISDDGGVTINTATKINGTDLTLSGTSVSVPPDLNVRSLSIDGPATISSVDATGTVTFSSDITFGTSVTIEADEINFGGNVIPGGPGITLTLRQKALNRTVNLGSIGSDPLDPIQDQLDLTALEISRIQSGFALVLIGRADATGLLQVLNPVTFNSPVTLDMRGVGSSISIAGRLAGAAGVPITVRGTGATTTISQDIVTQGQPILIDDSVIVAGTPTLDTTDGGAFAAGANVTITGTTNADVTNRSLAIDAGTGAGAGAAVLQGAVGTGSGLQPLDSLTITGGTISLPVVTTAGLQAYNGATTVGGNLTSTGGGVIGFDGPTTLSAATLRFQTAGGQTDNIVFDGTLDGASALTLDVGPDGQAVFNAPVGAATALSSLSVDGNTLLTASPVTFRTSGGAIGFLGQINGPGEFLTVESGSGTVTLGGNVGVTGAMGAFTINAPTILGTNVTVATTGITALNGTVNGPGNTLTVNASALTLGGNVGGSGGLGAVTINAPATLGAPSVAITTANAPVAFAGPISGSSALSVLAGTGAVTFGGAVGSVGSPLLSLAATGSTVSIRDVNTTGSQTYTGASILSGDLLAAGPAPISFSGVLDMNGAARSVRTLGGSIFFQQRVDGGPDLAVDAGVGAVTFGGAVGSQVPLASLSSTGGSTQFRANVTTSGAGGVTVNGPLSVSGVTIAVNSNGQGDIRFNGPVDGSPALSLDSGARNVAVTGDIGGTLAPATLTVNAARIDLAGVHTQGNQVYSGLTSIAGNAAADAGTFRINGATVLGTDGASTTYSSQGAYFGGGVWLLGDSVVDAGGGQIFFASTVETAQTIGNNPVPTGVAASGNRALTLRSSLQPSLQFTGSDSNNPFLDDPTMFDAYVNAPFLFNATVGGAYTGGSPPSAADRARMLRTLTFDRGGSASSVAPVATIIMSKGLLNADGSGRFTITPEQADIISRFGQQGTSNVERDMVTSRILTTEGFDLGAGGKLLAVGNFYSYVDVGTGTLGAVLSDISSLNNINIIIGDRAAGSIKIRPRAGGAVTSNLFTSTTPAVADASEIAGSTVSPIALADSDVDLVALGTIAFSVQPELASTGTARMATPTASTNPSATQVDDGTGTFVPFLEVGILKSVVNGNLLLTPFQLPEGSDFDVDFNTSLLLPGNGILGLNGAPTAGQPFPNLTAFGLGMDFRAEGAPTRGDLATSLASAASLATSLSQGEISIVNTVALGANVIEDLLQLGLEVKNPNSPAYIAVRAMSITGRTDYDDVPPYAKPDPERLDYRISIDRLSAESVHAVLDAYYALVGEDNTARAERKRQIQGTIGAAWEKYATPIEEEGGTPDGVGFRRFVEADESEKQTLEYLNQIATLLNDIDRLALSPVELRGPKLKTLSDLRGELMSPEQLEEAALGVPVQKPTDSVAMLAAPGGDAR